MVGRGLHAGQGDVVKPGTELADAAPDGLGRQAIGACGAGVVGEGGHAMFTWFEDSVEVDEGSGGGFGGRGTRGGGGGHVERCMDEGFGAVVGLGIAELHGRRFHEIA